MNSGEQNDLTGQAVPEKLRVEGSFIKSRSRFKWQMHIVEIVLALIALIIAHQSFSLLNEYNLRTVRDNFGGHTNLIALGALAFFVVSRGLQTLHQRVVELDAKIEKLEKRT